MDNDAWSVLGVFLAILAGVILVGEFRRRRWRRHTRLSRDAHEAMMDGRFGDADGRLSELLAEFPRDAWGAAMRGVCRIRLDDAEGTVADCLHAIRCGWNHGDIHINLGWARMKMGNLDAALSEFAKGIALQPKNPDGFGYRGQARYLSGMYREAADDYSAALELRPDDSIWILNRAACRLVLGEFSLAKADLAEVLRREPDSIEAFRIRAAAHYGMADFASALAEARRVLETEPGNWEMLNLIAWIEATCPVAEFRNGSDAVALSIRACELTRFTDAYCLGTRAAAHAESGDFGEAVRWGQEARRLGTAEFQAGCDERIALYEKGQPYRESKPYSHTKPTSMKNT